MNKIEYANIAERASRIYELKLESLNTVNVVIAVTNYDGSIQYGFDELDRYGNGTMDVITIIY